MNSPPGPTPASLEPLTREDTKTPRARFRQIEKLRALAGFAQVFATPGCRFVEAGNSDPHEQDDDGQSGCELTKETLSFIDALYKSGWVKSFDWASWAETMDGKRLLEEPQHIAMATPDQLTKVLTVLVRRERFCEGTLNSAFEAGFLTAIVQRAQVLLNAGLAAEL
ncbi:MAG: DUF6508 domain-containing protein [Acidobacteriaceae bacterium]